MHPTVFSRESAVAQERMVAAAERIGRALGLTPELPKIRVHGDLNQIQVSALNQRKAVAAFFERIAEALDKPAPGPEAAPVGKKKARD